jgi:hypothetical protein
MPNPSSAIVNGPMKRGQYCDNFNHRRPNAPVRSCPTYGEIVNQSLPIKKCTQNEHAKKRWERSKFYVHCSEQLMKGTS